MIEGLNGRTYEKKNKSKHIEINKWTLQQRYGAFIALAYLELEETFSWIQNKCSQGPQELMPLEI